MAEAPTTTHTDIFDSGQSYNKSKAVWNRTDIIEERVKRSARYDKPDNEAKYGRFDGRPIIGRDSPINGGVYLGANPRETIVVDDNEDPRLDSVYQLFWHDLDQIHKDTKLPINRIALRLVFKTVQQTIFDDTQKTNDFIANIRPDEKVKLGEFIDYHYGVCRHQALLAGYLLERLKKEGHLLGDVSVDRNETKGRGAHVWARYTSLAGTVFIIDPTLNYIGKLEDDQGRKWTYERPKPPIWKFWERFKKR